MSKKENIDEGILDAFKGRDPKGQVAGNIEDAINSMKAGYVSSSSLLIANIDKLLVKLGTMADSDDKTKLENKFKAIKTGLEYIKTYAQDHSAFKSDSSPTDLTSWSADMVGDYPDSYDKDLFAGIAKWNLAGIPPNDFPTESSKIRQPFLTMFLYAARQIKNITNSSEQGITKEKLKAAITEMGLGSDIESETVFKAFGSMAGILGFIKDPLTAIKAWRARPPGAGTPLDKLAKAVYEKEEAANIDNMMDNINKYMDFKDDDVRAEIKKQFISAALKKKKDIVITVKAEDITNIPGKTQIAIKNLVPNINAQIDKFIVNLRTAINQAEDIFDQIYQEDPAITKTNFGNFYKAAQSVKENFDIAEDNPFKQYEGKLKENTPFVNKILNLRKYEAMTPGFLQKLFNLAMERDDIGSLEESKKRKTVQTLIRLIEQEMNRPKEKTLEQKLVKKLTPLVEQTFKRKKHG